MDPVSEGKQVLSEIEKSIQDTLALFQSKDHVGGYTNLFPDDDPIVSLHVNKSEEKYKTRIDCQNVNNMQINDLHSNIKEHYQEDCRFDLLNTNYDSSHLPFLKDPIKNTIEEMQRVLNYKDQMAFPTNNEPSPEEILDLYSLDLGISLSGNTSPRGDIKEIEKGLQITKSNIKNKKSCKKIKPLKNSPPQNNKLEMKKKLKEHSLETTQSKENKVKELINIYGCSDRVKKTQSESTTQSKRGVSRNISVKQLANIHSSKSSSICQTKRGKKKKKNLNTNSIDLVGSEFAALEKSSRISTKRTSKHNSHLKNKTVTKKMLKRKSGNNLSNTFMESNDSINLSLHKNKFNDLNHLSEHYNPVIKPKQSKELNNHKSKLQVRQLSNKYTSEPKVYNSNKTVLKAFPKTKENYKQNNSKLNQIVAPEPIPDMTVRKSISVMARQSINDNHVLNPLHKNMSDEIKLNKHIIFNEKDTYDSGPDSHMSYDAVNESLRGLPSQMHYTLPTQSSRSKEVERFLNGHYQHLPFVIGQSTSKSHNLWVNIQEALSLIKQKVPQSAEKQSEVFDVTSERPLSVLSKLTTKSSKKNHICPAVLHDGLYDIPETEMEETAAKSWEDHPDCIQANIDPSNVRPRCSCILQPSLSYKKVLRQIFGGGTDASEISLGSNKPQENLLHEHGDSYAAELRKVLIDFTQEFELLNNKYEEMLLDPNTSKEELQRLGQLLETREEEIKEILARFNEVKEINEKAQSHDLKSRVGFYSLESFKSTTSVRLAQTLRRVQQFKESLKSRPSVLCMSKSVPVHSLY